MRSGRSFLVLSSLSVIFVGLLLAETLMVKVQSTNLRKSPKFYAPVIHALAAGERVEKISSQEGWFQVKTAKGVIGWLHSSAVEVQKFSLMALDKSMKTKASASEVALAGKGFNKQVEESYRAKHSELNFALVDRMLQIKIPLAQVEEFMKKGKLGDFGGDR